MELFFREFGNSGTPLIIVHGLYGASDNWVTIGKQLSEHFKVYIIDQRNHGSSPHSSSHSYNDMSNDLLSFMDNNSLKSAHLLGHSMGGKTVMHFALNHPDRTEKLIAVDIAPKSYGSMSNYALKTNNHAAIVSAMLHTPLPQLNNRSEIDKHLQDEIPNDQVRQFLLKNIKRATNGVFEWKLNINAISDNLEEILDGFSSISPIEYSYTKPAIFIKGEKSSYLLDEDMFLTRKYFPKSEFTTIPNAGHWLHAEQPDLFIKTILYFLQN